MAYVKHKDEYWRWLSKADWVLSTAKHEFFGISVVEALFAGCLPWLPEKLSYRELLPDCARGISPTEIANRENMVNEILPEILSHLHMAKAVPATHRIDTLITNLL
jgi:hypothetical protein